MTSKSDVTFFHVSVHAIAGIRYMLWLQKNNENILIDVNNLYF
jgi:hypothetical protein